MKIIKESSIKFENNKSVIFNLLTTKSKIIKEVVIKEIVIIKIKICEKLRKLKKLNGAILEAPPHRPRFLLYISIFENNKRKFYQD